MKREGGQYRAVIAVNLFAPVPANLLRLLFRYDRNTDLHKHRAGIVTKAAQQHTQISARKRYFSGKRLERRVRQNFLMPFSPFYDMIKYNTIGSDGIFRADALAVVMDVCVNFVFYVLRNMMHEIIDDFFAFIRQGVALAIL